MLQLTRSASPALPQGDCRERHHRLRHCLRLQGEAAALTGEPVESNPYPAGTLAAVGWLEGWACGKWTELVLPAQQLPA